MNPMQGPRNSSGSSTDENQTNGESIYSTEISLDDMLNPVDNGFANNSVPSVQSTYASSSSHSAQNHNWWKFGESSSGPSDHQLPQDGRQIGFNGMVVHGGVHGSSHIRNGPSFLLGSSSNRMSQDTSVSMDMYIDGFGAQTSLGSSFGSSIQATGESSSGPGSSLGIWGSSCKRRALEGAPDCFGQNGALNAGLAQYGASSSLSLATPSQSFPSLTNYFGRTEQMFGSGGGRAVATTNAFHFTRDTDNISRPGRRLNPREPQESVAFSISHAGSSVRPTGSLQQTVPLNSPSVDTLDMRSISVTGGSSTGENQTNIVHLPALTRNIHQFVLDASFSSRASNPPGNGIPAERFGAQWETQRNNSEQPMFATETRNPVHDQSIWSFTRENPGSSSIGSPFVPRAGPSSTSHPLQPNDPTRIPPQSTPLHNPSRISELPPLFLFPSIEPQSASHSVSSNEVAMTSGSSSIGSPFVPRAGLSSTSQPLPPNDPTWFVLPSIEPQSASHGASLPFISAGPAVSSNEVAMPSGSNSRSHRSRQRRSALLSERQSDLLRLRHLGRSLPAGIDGRTQLISEIRQVLSAMRRGENLRTEEYMVIDPLIFQGMTEMRDRHRDMRLDVDNMSYEELLALGERIGDVSTGLKEETILKVMKQHKHTSSSAELQQDIEPCCICQEEYIEGEDVGTIECGHEFHKECIKKWLMLKNICPICKTMALST